MQYIWIKKSLTKSIQYLPKRLINNRLKPATKIGESFRHLGKYFNFNMSDKQYSAADKVWYYKNCAFFEKSMKFLTQLVHTKGLFSDVKGSQV